MDPQLAFLMANQGKVVIFDFNKTSMFFIKNLKIFFYITSISECCKYSA